MLTDAQIERAAREYCRMIGVDPDSLVEEPLARLGDPYRRFLPQVCSWEIHASRIREHAMMQRAVEIATEDTGK